MITHRFHAENAQIDAGIVYGMIVDRDIMLQLGLKFNFERQILEWYETIITMVVPGNLLGQSDLTKLYMQEIVMKTAEPASTREVTERVVKILDHTYERDNLDKVAEDEVQLHKNQ